MRLTIDNTTGLLNDYYFQTLSLLYFPGEKFPESGDTSPASAEYTLKRQGNGYYGKAVLHAGDRTASAEFSTDGYVFTVPVDEKNNASCAIGTAVLRAGRELFGFTPPWGYLSGLRPVKRARYYLTRGYDEDTVRTLFTRDYGVSEEKTELSLRTALRETEMLRGIGGKDAALYISIPFCPTRCEYCSFVSYATPRLLSLIPDYLDRLIADLASTARVLRDTGVRLVAVYVGGGTPSILDPKQTDRLLGAVGRLFDMSSVREFTFEAGRPDTVTREKLAAVKAQGVTRISINPQSLNQNVLKAIGRQHTVDQFFDAYETARSVGFSCINADLIAGLPEDTEESFRSGLEKVISMGFESLTLHTLSIKNAAPLRFDREDVYDPAGILAASCVSYAYDRLTGCGYEPYYLYRQKNTVGNCENTGYSRPGQENLYNVLMMEEYASVFACGAGAITKLVSPDGNVIERLAHRKYPYEYLSDSEGIGEERIKEFYVEHFND